MADAPSNPRLLTFASGGWVLLLTGFFCLALIAWATLPAILRSGSHPPGDGRNIETYGFDLSNLAVPRDLVAAAMLHRDMIPVMFNPTASGPEPMIDGKPATDPWEVMQRRNDPQYGKYLVPGDKVIGVEINGEARAYPLHVLYVHEIINDALGGAPIAVTYNWPCDSAVVFDRRVNGKVLEFGASGLVYNSNLLMYNRPPAPEPPESPEPNKLTATPSLWPQLLARAVSGPAADEDARLTVIPDVTIATWSDWVVRHPQTTVLDRDLSFAKRYKDAAPTPYFKSDEIMFPVRPMPAVDVLPPKTPTVVVRLGERRRVYPISYVINLAQKRTSPEGPSGPSSLRWTDRLGSTTLEFACDPVAQTVQVAADPPEPVEVIYAYWFAWHSTHPEDELIKPSLSGE